MSVIFLLIPLSIVLAACFLGAFIWAVRSGQCEDTHTPSMRVLLDEPKAAHPIAKVVEQISGCLQRQSGLAGAARTG